MSDYRDRDRDSDRGGTGDAAGTAAAGEYAALLERVGRDRHALGLVLTGSRAREGTATARSDYDVYLVAEDGAEHGPLAAERRRDGLLDVVLLPLTEFRAHALPGSGTEWNRYAFTRAEVVKDTADGLIAELVAAKGRLTQAEAAESAPELLDAFLNSVYRCLKSDRDGRSLAARLDGADTVPYFLGYAFALDGRVRPYNKYLEWELRHHPLDRAEWAPDRLLPLLGEVLSERGPRAVRRLFREVEPYARARGHGPVLDGWGDDLELMRGSESGSGDADGNGNGNG
ncbi:hypothetical protein [Streptomyces inusitatus]|uniref:hypothetical protein n=1 Tax=Streptomyces inusitatus TaxID=68221 RepID=UPI001E40D972|nr:hypothetical protein [Streptomyces inusitatus]